MRHSELADCLYLVRCGVPYDVAFELDEPERIAYVVSFGLLDGLSFDWQKMRWDNN
jgi:hypothetical protein